MRGPFFQFITVKTFIMVIEDYKASFSRHADTPVPTSAAELQQTAPVLQGTAAPGRPTQQTPAPYWRGGREAQGGRKGGRNWRGETLIQQQVP